MKEITEDYVDFDTAKLLKEKGFDEYCLKNYWESDKELHDWTWELSYGKNSEKNTCCKDCSAPTLQMAMKWLREVHGIFITILQTEHTTVTMEQEYFFYRIQKNRINVGVFTDTFKKPEQACDAAIKYCLENLI